MPHNPVGILTYPAGNKHMHTDICFAFITAEDPLLRVDENESDQMYSMMRSEFEALSPEEMFGNVREVISYLYDVILLQWRPDSISDL